MSKSRLQPKPAKVVSSSMKAGMHKGVRIASQQMSELVALLAAGRCLEASVLAKELTVRYPRDGNGWKALGVAFAQLGRSADALGPLQQAAALLHGDAELHSNLGGILDELGRREEAETSYRKALQLNPGLDKTHFNLGNVLKDMGRLSEAEDSYRCALQISPHVAVAHYNLGLLLYDRGRLGGAEKSYRSALQLNPDYAHAHFGLGNVLKELDRLEEAETCFRAALKAKPNFAGAHNNLGNALMDMGRLDEAITSFQRALEIEPDKPETHSSSLLCLNYIEHLSAAEVHAEHLRWAAQLRQGAAQGCREHREGDRSPQRRLRLGYVSPDLCQHSVAYFFEPLLREHDRQRMEVFCYAGVERPDAVTARLQGFAEHWCSTVGLSDEALTQRIADDNIDILVDLTGHTAKNRLLVFARKPAPVQVTWLGYPNSTGLSAIDYRLVDAVTDPPGDADAWASETLMRLESGFLCYGVPTVVLPPSAPPGLAGGRITFGCFNNPAKLSSATLDAWATLLDRVPVSQLLLKGKRFGDARSRDAFLEQLQRRGVDTERVTLHGLAPDLVSHLRTYSQVDIALDPLTYNGTTTTCEALWMGVPVVTLCGDRHAARVGASLLTQIGMEELIAPDVEAYVSIAAALAIDTVRLAEMRLTLRERLVGSSLCDAPAFARKMEATYRDMWRRYCASEGGVNVSPTRGYGAK